MKPYSKKSSNIVSPFASDYAFEEIFVQPIRKNSGSKLYTPQKSYSLKKIKLTSQN